MLKWAKVKQNIVIWENYFKLSSQGPSVYEAKCNECNKVFFIKSGGKADI